MSEQKIIKEVAVDATTATVILGGALNIEASSELRRVLGEALAEAPRVLLDTLQLEGLDITILQTICSACKTAAASGRRLLAEGALPDCMMALNGGIGARMALPCRQNNDQTCIWFKGAL